jgi:DNA-binding NtrC family response regulator
MVAYPWRGNVRELQNCIERAVILTDGDTIHARHLNLTSHLEGRPEPSDGEHGPWASIDLSGSLADASRRVLHEVERRKIRQALKEASGNPGLAAESLQVSYKVMLTKIKELGLG